MKIKKYLFRLRQTLQQTLRRTYLVLLLLLTVFAVAITTKTALFAFLSNSYYFISSFGSTALSSTISNGGYTVQQTIFSDITDAKLTGGGYEISGIANSQPNSKLETDLTKAHCYPNPFKPSLGHTKITFANLTSHTKVKVFNIAGKLVYENEDDTLNGELVWNASDNDGDPLASGLYIYIITGRTDSSQVSVANSQNHKKSGKIAIIR
ncbi:MAG: T9SS type A sorting domain-containing protein [Elusimicrobiota bacterium]